MKKQHLLLIFLMIYSSVVISKSNNEIKMILDLIKDSDQVTSVIANLCWKPFKQVQMVSQLADTKIAKMVLLADKEWANIVEPQHRERVLVLADISCPTTKDFFEMANATRKFGFPYRWIIIGKEINETTAVTSEFGNLHLYPDANVIIAQKNNTDSFILNMIYKINPKKEREKWIVEQIGIWTSLNGLKKFELAKSSISARRKNLKRETIKTAMVILDNRTMSNPYDLRDILSDTIPKSSIRQVVPLYSYMNASRTLIFTETWGYYRNGTHGGMIAEMTKGDADIGGTVLYVTKDRLEVVDYLSSPIPISIKFVFREPPLSYQNNLFLLPFETAVWYCMGAFVLVLGFILYITALWESKMMGPSSINPTDLTALKPSVSDMAFLVISAMSQQGSSTELKGTLGRIVRFILFLAFLLLYSSYTASIVTLLQSTSDQIRTLSDLLNSRLELGVEDAPYNRYFFQIATDPVRKAIYQTKIAPRGTEPKFMSLEAGVKKLQTEAFAFNMNKGIGYKLVERYFHEHQKCGLQEIEYLYTMTTYITCRKESPYKEIFKIGLFRIRENGLSDRENRLIYARKPACRARGGNFVSVNMIDFHPVVLMYLYGILLAFAFLAIEILVHKKQLLQCRVRNKAASLEPSVEKSMTALV